MGEDRTTCAEKTPNDVLQCRHRHSSVISSCSEDAESEATSGGYPPSPDEDRGEELEYGPGIVNKLRTRYLSITLKQNRGANMRRSCSMENLLDQDRPCGVGMFCTRKRFSEETSEIKNTIWGNLKRAKSMDTLLMDIQQQQQQQEASVVVLVNGEVKKEPKIIRRKEGGLNRAIPTINDEELPKPDTVKTYKRMFEPAESRRGSQSRRPPVLRASAKSVAASKVANGVSTNPSAKVNGTAAKSKVSAKQSPTAPVKAQPESVVYPKEATIPLLNGEGLKPVCNGTHTVKAIPIKITDFPLCNGKVNEKDLNVRNSTKKDPHCNEKFDTLCNGNSSHDEVIEAKTKEDISNQSSIIKNNKVTNTALSFKPKIPPNRPAFLKKPTTKINDTKNSEKKAPLIPKLKSPSPERSTKSLESSITTNSTPNKVGNSNLIEMRLKENSRDMKDSNKNVEDVLCHKEKEKLTKKLLEENNRKNSEKTILGTSDHPKTNLSISPSEKKVENGVISPKKVENVDISHKKLENGVISPKKMENGIISPQKLENAVISPQKLENAVISPKILENGIEENKKLENRLIGKKKHENGIVLNSDTADIKIKKETTAADTKPAGSKVVKKSQSQSGSSMVFDFRGKDVVPHVAVLPVPFGCKALHPKKRPLMVDGIPNGNGVASDDEDDDYVDYSVPAPCGVIFEGENVKVGKGSILAIRNKDLKITFDDDVDNNTFVYPSESSMLDETDSRTPSPDPAENEIIPNGQPPPNKLKTNTSIGSAGAGGLQTYTPSVLRTVDNFHPGMFRLPPAPVLPPEKKEESHKDDNKEEEENTRVDQEPEDALEEMLKPADPEVISSWSISAGTSDLLF